MITIKDVCAILGIAPSTIRLYEKYLPSASWAVGENGYRGFYFENILHLMDCRVMVKYGVPLQDALQVSMSKSVEAKKDVLDQQREHLSEELRRLSDLMLVLDEQRELVGKIPDLLVAFEMVDMDAFLHFPCVSRNILPGLRDLVSQWAAAIPFAAFTPYYNVSDYAAGRCSVRELARAGFTIPLRFAHRVPTDSESVTFVPAQRCLATVVSMTGVAQSEEAAEFTGGLPFDGDMFERTSAKLAAMLSSIGFELRGNIYTRLIHAEYPDADEACGSVPSFYFYVWTPLLEEGPAFERIHRGESSAMP